MYKIYLENGMFIISRHDFIVASLSGDISFFGIKAPLSITGATNANPIVITTAVANGLLNGSRVNIQGVEGNTAANGSFFAKPLTSTTFEIYNYYGTNIWSGGVEGNGTYVANTGRMTAGGMTVSVNQDTVVITASGLMPNQNVPDSFTIPVGSISSINGVAPTDTTLNGIIAALTTLAKGVTGNQSTRGTQASYTMVRPTGTSAYSTAKAVLGTNLAVSGATNATPIVITTGTHNLVDRQPVTIASVGGNTNANGNFYVKVLTATTFALYSDPNLTTAVAGSGNYTTGGTVAAIGILKDVARINGGGGYVTRVRCMTNNAAWGSLSVVVKIHFFSEPPTGILDAAAYPLMFANADKRVYPLTMDALVTEGAGSDASAAAWLGAMAFTCASDRKDLYYVTELLSWSGTTLTPASAQQTYVQVATDLA